jgi:hypothetical protein
MESLLGNKTIRKAVDELNKQFAIHYDGCGLPEACASINDASRSIVRAVIQVRGHAYVCKINRDDDERRKPVFRLIENAEEVKNFDASYVLAEPDTEMEKMLLERESSPYTGVRDDAKRIDEIADHATSIGALDLIWT